MQTKSTGKQIIFKFWFVGKKSKQIKPIRVCLKSEQLWMKNVKPASQLSFNGSL